MRPRPAILALAPLIVALALAACSGGEPPPAAPAATPPATATAEPTATATPTPTPPATPTPDARSGLDLIEPAPGAFTHRTFEDGEAIEWEHGIFVLDVETGRTEGYALAGVDPSNTYGDGLYYPPHRGGWIVSLDEWRKPGWGLLLDRETGRSWRWPHSALRLAAAAEHGLLFEDLSADRRPTGRFTLANRGMEEIARFSVGADGDWPHPVVSPDGRAIAFVSAGVVYLVPVETGVPAVLFEGANRIRQLDDGSGIVVEARRERRYFGWDGAEAPGLALACPGKLSPDGRYAAVQDGGPYRVKHDGVRPLDRPWPSVVVTDAETCAPIFRVQSAHAYRNFWQAEWLSTSEGFVVGVLGGFVIARVQPEPALASLPSGRQYEPDAAPTGGGRYFGYGPRVYDAAKDRWRGPGQVEMLRWGPFWWGSSHRERWFSYPVYSGGAADAWLLLPPKIEFPPFGEEIAFRVARTGSCLRLREEPGEEGRVLGCLPDGERLLFAERGAEVERDREGRIRSPNASLSGLSGARASGSWVYVRTAGGAEGWVSHDYLDHD